MRTAEKVPSVLDALKAYKWHDDAACADSDDPDLWFSEQWSGDRGKLSTPGTLEAFLTCVTCPVRRDCLGEALTTWRVVLPYLEGEGAVGVRAQGVWGATTDKDRGAVADLPIADAIDQLELGLAGRVRKRVDAFEAHYRRDGRRNQGAERVWATLDEMREKLGVKNDPAT